MATVVSIDRRNTVAELEAAIEEVLHVCIVCTYVCVHTYITTM